MKEDFFLLSRVLGKLLLRNRLPRYLAARSGSWSVSTSPVEYYSLIEDDVAVTIILAAPSEFLLGS